LAEGVPPAIEQLSPPPQSRKVIAFAASYVSYSPSSAWPREVSASTAILDTLIVLGALPF
jgi:hypothetical protein